MPKKQPAARQKLDATDSPRLRRVTWTLCLWEAELAGVPGLFVAALVVSLSISNDLHDVDLKAPAADTSEAVSRRAIQPRDYSASTRLHIFLHTSINTQFGDVIFAGRNRRSIIGVPRYCQILLLLEFTFLPTHRSLSPYLARYITYLHLPGLLQRQLCH